MLDSSPVERLQRIDWKAEDVTRYGSNLRLLRESAIRFAHWATKLKDFELTRYAVFFDVAACLEPGVAPSINLDLSTIENEIARRTAPWMMNWQTLMAGSSDRPPGPDPFEPCLLCFERGGRPFTHHGSMHIEHSISFTFGHGLWPEQFAAKPISDLATLDLDQIDSEVNARLGRSV